MFSKIRNAIWHWQLHLPVCYYDMTTGEVTSVVGRILYALSGADSAQVWITMRKYNRLTPYRR